MCSLIPGSFQAGEHDGVYFKPGDDVTGLALAVAVLIQLSSYHQEVGQGQLLVGVQALLIDL